MIVELPVSGIKVTLSQRVSNKQRKEYVAKMEAGDTIDTIVREPVRGPDGNVLVGPDGSPYLGERVVKSTSYGAALDSLDMLLGFLIEEWTLTDDDGTAVPTPRESGTLDAIDNLDVEDYDVLSEATRPVIAKLFPNFNVNPDEGSPTTPSSASDGRSTAKP